MGFQLNQCQARQGAPKSLGCLPPSGAHFCRASALVTIGIRPDIE
jgi:hypothetical protein